MEINKKAQTISIIIAALNEEDNIEAALLETLAALDYYKIDGEIIAVNDGSTDKTGELILALASKDPRIKLINHNHPYGLGAVFLEGVDQSQKEIVTLLPGDNENDPLEILRYFDLLEHVDIIIPFVYNLEVRSPLRNFLSSIYLLIINKTFGTNFNYTNGTVIYRRLILSESSFNCKGFFFQTEILIKSVMKGYLFAEVPYRLKQRASGKSSAISISSFLILAREYLQLCRYIIFSRKDKNNNLLHKDSITASRRSR